MGKGENRGRKRRGSKTHREELFMFRICQGLHL